MAEGTLEITISNQTIRVSAITVTGAGSATTIETEMGTLQMSAHIDPHDAQVQTVTWSVIEVSGSALINSLGLLVALADGTVRVRATANDSSGIYGELVITISNQAAPTLVTDITVTSAGDATTIIVDKGTLQMYADVEPSDATYDTVTWSVINGTGMASINASGLLSALSNGTVTVRATATDGSAIYGEFEITISNQSVLLRVPDNFDFSLQDVADVVSNYLSLPLENALIECFDDAGATRFDPTHAPDFDPRYEGYHERLTNFRNYPIEVNVNPSNPETLYNWYAVNKHTGGGGTTNGDIYGGLYNWYAVNTGKLAPIGWHVPTQAEWTALYNYLGIGGGGALKESGTEHWLTPNTGATNSTGFTALPGGENIFEYYGKGYEATFRASTLDYYSGLPYNIVLYNEDDKIYHSSNPEYIGYSVRCIKDDSDDLGTVTDIDGNVYPTVKIGDQVWMAENYKVEHYSNGIPIPIIQDPMDFAADTDGAMCYYDNEAPSVAYLLPPAGWHIPTHAEFETLANALGGWLVAGGHLKRTGFTNWRSPNTGADNASGFDAIGAGCRDFHANFIDTFRHTLFWNLESYDESDAFISQLDSGTARLNTSIGGVSFPMLKIYGASVRCIKDDSNDPGTVTDIDGNVYPTVRIGDQVWMALNLIVTHYNDNTDIPELSDPADWMNDEDGARCYYD